MSAKPNALPLARRLLAAGVPVVVVQPCPGPARCGNRRPHDEDFPPWKHITSAEQCDLSAYRPGVDALALIGGHGVDLVDEDVKDEGSADHLPPFAHYGVTRTPSGGRHLVVPSTGIGKISPLDAEGDPGRHVGDYVGGTRDHGSRLLGFLPGSVRAKHGGAAYVEEEPWDLAAALAADPDPRLVSALERAGGSYVGAAGRDAVTDADVAEFVAAHEDAEADDYGAATLARLLAAFEAAVPGDPVRGRHGAATRTATRAVEVIRDGCLPSGALDALRDAFLAVKPDAEGEWADALAWAVANAKGRGACLVHARVPAAEEFEPVSDAPDPARPGDASGWEPVDLTATVAGLLDGTITRPEPTIGDFGGGCLFYAGRINSVHGDSTGGKTWTALVTAKQELDKGETVVYVDLEDSAEGVVSRLLDDLDVPADAVRERFVYLHPEERLTDRAAGGLAALLAARGPSLVVVDSTGEALAIEGANPNADEEVARWFRLLPRLAVRCGAAVLLLDHATKAGENDLWPIGSQRKRAAVTGAAYLQKVARPFGKDQDGKAVLRCAKDRHGNYPLRREVAALQVRGGQISLVPGAGAGARGDFQPTGYMERVSRVLEAATEPLSLRAVREAVTGNKQHVADALAALVKEGYVRATPGARNATLHASVKPFREDPLP